MNSVTRRRNDQPPCPTAVHAATCGHGYGSVSCHNDLRDTCASLLRKAPLHVGGLRKEHLFAGQETLHPKQRKRADLFFDAPTIAASPVAVDVTVVSPHTPAHTAAAAAAPAGAATAAEETKHIKYAPFLADGSIQLWAIGFDIFGAAGTEARKRVRRLSEIAASRRGTSPDAEYARLMTRLSGLVLHSTAVAVNRRLLHPDRTPCN